MSRQLVWIVSMGLEDFASETLPAIRARADRLGLDRADPVQRAIAERVHDEEAIARLLSAAGGA